MRPDCTARALCHNAAPESVEPRRDWISDREAFMALVLANILAVVSGLLGALFLLGVLNPR